MTSSVLSHQSHAVLPCKSLCSGTDEVDVRAFIQHQPRRANRIAQPLDAGDSAGAQIRAVHQQGVHLHAAILRQKRAASGVEGLVVFHDGDRGLDRIDGTRSLFEQA